MDLNTLMAAKAIAKRLIDKAAIDGGNINLTSYVKKTDLAKLTLEQISNIDINKAIDNYVLTYNSYKQAYELAPKLTEDQLNAINEIKNKVSKDGDKTLTDVNFTKEYEAKLTSLENFSKKYSDLIGVPDIPSLEGYATEKYVLNLLKDINTDDIDLSEYEKTIDVNNKLLTKAEKNHVHEISEINNLSDTLFKYYSKTETLSKEEITEMVAAIAKGINWKESVNTSDDLPQENNSRGDARIIINTNIIAVWNGTEWVQTGSASVTNLASSTLDGLMSKEDKIKIDLININNLATKEDLNSKSNSDHIHTEYVEKEAGKSLVPDTKIAEWDAKANNADIPVNISQLNNDKLYIDKATLLNELSNYLTQDSINSLLVNYVKREEISSMLTKNNIVAGKNIEIEDLNGKLIIKTTGSDNHTNRDVLDLLSTDGESLYFNGKNIQKIELEDGQYGYSGTFMNVVADSTYSINIDKGSKLCEQIVQVWEFEEGGNDITTVLKNFNNAEKNNFYYNNENIIFDNDKCKIKDEYIIDNKTKNGDYHVSEAVNMDELIDIDSISDTVGYKYLVNNSPIGFRCNLSTNNYAVQYNIYVDGSMNYSTTELMRNYEGGGTGLALFYDEVKAVLIPNKFNNVCHAIINNNLYIIVNGEHIIDKGPKVCSGGNQYLFYFGADPNGTSSTSPPEQMQYALQGYHIYKFAYFTKITSLEDFKSVLDTKMKYDASTKFITQFHDFSNTANLKPVVGTQAPFNYTASRFSQIKTKYLLKSNDKYYSLKNENYNADTGLYNEVIINSYEDFNNNCIEVEKFMEETTIGNETFRPIDKFNNFEIISNDEFELILKGIKSNRETVIAKNSFPTRLTKNIDFFELATSISNTSSIKVVVSVDNGITWKTFAETDFIDLTNICPLKEYSTLSEDEKIQWNTFRDEVNEKGIDSKILNTIDFNSIKTDEMMFAYVFSRDLYKDTCEMSKLQYQFDANGSYTLLNSDSVVNIKQSVDAISVTPKKDIELMKVNIGSSGEVNIIQNGGTADIDLPTDEEVDNMINGVMSDVFA